MFVLFDNHNNCYGLYDKLEYVKNLSCIVNQINPEIRFICKKYTLNTNNFESISVMEEKNGKKQEYQKLQKVCDDRFKAWYEKFENDLKLYEKIKLEKNNDIPLIFEDKYNLFQKMEELGKIDKFDCFIDKFYLKDQNDSSFYELF